MEWPVGEGGGREGRRGDGGRRREGMVGEGIRREEEGGSGRGGSEGDGGGEKEGVEKKGRGGGGVGTTHLTKNPNRQ